jgi:PAS domain S-box-containing protein
MSAQGGKSQDWLDVLLLCDTGAWEIDSTGQKIGFSSFGQKIFKVSENASIFLPVFIEMVQAPYRKVLSDHLKSLISNSKAFCDELYLKDLTCIRIKGCAINKVSSLRFLGTIEVLSSRPEQIPEQPVKNNISERYYQTLFQFNPLPIFILDHETLKMVDCNRHALLKYGYNKDEFLNLNLKDIWPYQDIPFLSSYVAEELKSNKEQERICRHITKSGDIFLVKVKGYNMQIDGKNFSMKLVNDITNQLEAEEQLLESLNELSDYRFALDESCLVIILDKEKNVEYLNQKFQDISGYQSHEIVGSSPVKVYEENSELEDCLIAVSKGEIWRGELKGKRGNGSNFWVDTVMIPFKDNKGLVYQYIWVAYDITEKKKAEELLFRERFLLRTVIDNLPIQIYVKDTEGRYIINNKFQYRDFLGFTTEEGSLGKTVFDYFQKEVAEKMTAMDMQIMNDGQSVRNFEESYLDNEGNLVWLLTSKVALRNMEDKIVGLVGMTKDVTSAKKEEENLKDLNQKLIKSSKELEHSNQELEQFAYLASHDLQEPLRMITGFLELLQKKYASVLDEKANQYIHFAVDGASRMKNIIMDLLTYSRVGRVEEKAKETELTDVVSNVLMLQKNLVEQKNAIINVGKLPKLKIPVSPIRQVFHNLINNSLKYQIEGKRPEISIQSKQNDDFWEFTVQDNGIGIPEASKHLVFVLFSRLHARKQFPGSGMGLAMCKKIIENMGGDIGFHSKEGVGTTFYFTMPKVIE